MIQKRFASSVNKKAAAVIYDVGRDSVKKNKTKLETVSLGDNVSTHTLK